MPKDKIYRVQFINQGKIFEIYAKYVASDLEMYGFVEISDLIFNNNAGIVVDPNEERLRGEFAGVQRTFIPMQSILRIDEVDKEGPAKISDANTSNNNVHQFPTGAAGLDPIGKR